MCWGWSDGHVSVGTSHRRYQPPASVVADAVRWWFTARGRVPAKSTVLVRETEDGRIRVIHVGRDGHEHPFIQRWPNGDRDLMLTTNSINSRSY